MIAYPETVAAFIIGICITLFIILMIRDFLR